MLDNNNNLGDLCPNTAMMFGTEKPEWCGDQMVKKFEDTFIRFDSTQT